MKILIVEDNIILCGMIEKWLQKAGYEVLAAIDEPGARNILKKNEINLVWKSHSTLTLLATQNYPFWLKYD